jgi:UDP-glucose 4-epimerase
LAAYAAEGLSHFIKRFNYQNNLIGSVNLINASINYKVQKFIFTSSIAVYGGSSELPMREETIPQPEDSYGIAKYAVERELQVCKELFDLDYIIFRPHNVYGERQNIGDKYRNVVGIFMNQILQGLPMTVFGDGEQTRAFSYIGDIIPIMVDCLTLDNASCEVFNIGADKPYTINQLAAAVAKSMNVEPTIKYLPTRNEVFEAYSSHEKVERFFGPRECVSLEEGLRNMADWVRVYGSRESKEFEEIEVWENFPRAWLKGGK